MKYESDLTDAQWEEVELMLIDKDYILDSADKNINDKRSAVNAILYKVANGCEWDNLPDTFKNNGDIKSLYDGFVRYMSVRELMSIWCSIYKNRINDLNNYNYLSNLGEDHTYTKTII